MPALDESDELLKAFGEAIRKRRKELGLSQEELAFRSGINRSYIGDIERGSRNIALTNIAKLAKALNISISALFANYGIEVDE